MFKKLILFAIIGGLVYLNYTNPSREDHEELLLAEFQARGPLSEDQFAEVLKDIDYSSFMICSATKTALDSKLISFGYLKQVRLINDQWINQTARKLHGQRD